MAALLSDADVGFGAGPKLLSDADVGFKAPPPAPYAAPTGGEFGDLSAQPWAQGAQPDPTDRAPAAQIADAAAQGFRDTPSLLAQMPQDFFEKSPIGRQIINPLAKAIPAVPMALMQAIAETVNQVTGNPRVGRDVMAALQVLPMAHIGTGVPAIESPAAGPPPRPRFMNEITAPDVSELDPRNAITALIAHDIEENPPISGAPGRGAANQRTPDPDSPAGSALNKGSWTPIADIGNAENIDQAIAAAGKAAQAPASPSAYRPITATQVAARDGVDIDQAFRTARAENDAGIAAPPSFDWANEVIARIAAENAAAANPPSDAAAPMAQGLAARPRAPVPPVSQPATVRAGRPGMPAPASDGAVQTLTMPSGQKVPARFDVAEAGDLIPASGDLQPRDRAGRLASDAQITQMAANLDPELLHASPGPDQGAPTVTQDGTILAGNGRTQAIRQAYAAGNADPYRAMVERLGFDTSGMSEPVLVRRINEQMTPEQQRQIAVGSNIPSGQRLSATEQAAIDARGMTAGIMAGYDPALTGGPTAAGNRGFVRSWVSTLPESERNAVQGADGSLSSDGLRRLQGAMLARAYGNQGLLARSLESTDDNMRGITGALTDAAPAWARLRAGIESGSVPPTMDIAPQLMRAVELVRQAREKGQSVRDVLAQSDAFDPMDPTTNAFVRVLYNPALTRSASRSVVGEILSRYATEAAKTSTEAGLFGDAQPSLTPGDILGTASRPGAGAPVPQSVGAAASRDMTLPQLTDMTPDVMKANRRRAEMDQLLAPPEANDTMIYVPGSFPTLAERSGDPNLSQYENLLRERVPQAFVGEGKILTENNKARVNEYENNTIPDPTLLTMRAKREAQFVADSKGILPTARPVDFNPAHDWVMEQLNDPMNQEIDAVRSVLEDFADRLTDDNGGLKTNPAAAWGIYKNLQNQLAKAKDPLNMTSAEKFAEAQLLEAKRLVGNALNVSTDNRFQLAMDNYAEASKAINAGVIFNDFRPKLTNMTGELQAQRFHQFVVNLAKERGDPGIDPSMDISDEGMRSMINIDNDLKRARLIKLGAPSGSQTNLLGALAESAGLDAAHSIVGKIPLAGGAFVAGQKYFAQRKLIADAGKHISPPEGGYTYPGGP